MREIVTIAHYRQTYFIDDAVYAEMLAELGSDQAIFDNCVIDFAKSEHIMENVISNTLA